MKRTREWDASAGGFTSNKRLKSPSGKVAIVPLGKRLYPPVRRAYAGSMVPLASRGYQLNSVEKKVFDVDTASYNINSAGFCQNLFQPTMGTDMSNRIGRKTVLKSCYMRGYLAVSNTLATPMTVTNLGSTLNRFIMYWDTQPNGAVPAVTDIIKAAIPSAQLNINNRDRFRILADKQISLDPCLFDEANYANCVNQIKPIKLFKRLDLETIFNGGNGGTVADISSGALGVLWINNQPSGQNGPVDFVGSYRIRFADP